MAELLVHVTQEGERWDGIAHRYYGNACLFTSIIEANPEVAIVPTLPGGLRLLVPVLDLEETVPVPGLPPWKR